MLAALRARFELDAVEQGVESSLVDHDHLAALWSERDPNAPLSNLL
jgi:hypothetical protein